MKSLFLYFNFFFFVILLILSCESGLKYTTKPNPYIISRKLKAVVPDYNYELYNSIENVDKYYEERKKALNLGVYYADLCYANTYGQIQETMLYWDCSKILANKLNLKNPYKQETIDKYEANIENSSAIEDIIQQVFDEIYNELHANNKNNQALLISIGSWTESLYIAICMTEIPTDAIKSGIIRQKTLFTEIKTTSDNLANNIFTDELSKLHSFYSSINETLTDDQYKSFAEIIISLRKKITG